MSPPDKRPALGKGLSALIPDLPEPTRAPATDVDVDRLAPNALQPRVRVDDARLHELAQSIRSNGVIQPIVVRRIGERFEIIAGERRWRAAKLAGLLRVPIVIRDVAAGEESSLLQMALIENIQREDLNPIEEAAAYRRLAEEFQLTQEQIAEAVGKDRTSIANHVRLLRLPDEVREALASGALSMVKKIAGGAAAPGAPASPRPVDVHTRAAEERLRLALGTRVRIVRKGKRGRIEIDFASEEELIRIYEQLTDRV
jgi:ParB family chromosome partitioning protein